jgi:hypothetical protein
VVVNIAQDEDVTVPFVGHPVLVIYVRFKDPGKAMYRMTSQSRMAEIGVQESDGLLDLEPDSLWQKLISGGESFA